MRQSETMNFRSSDVEKQNDDGKTLPMSTVPTEVGSVDELSSTPSIDSTADEPAWPRAWRAYTCWLGCFFLMFNSWGLVNAYGTFSSHYVGHSLENAGQLKLNLIGSTQSFIVLLFSAPVGRLMDAGHYRSVIGTGSFFVPFGMFMLSIAHPDGNVAVSFINVWLTQGLVVGLGMACFFVSSSQVAATWFPKRKALAVGVVACGASIAGVVYPTMTRYLIVSLGFKSAVRCVAGLSAFTSLYSLLFATPNPKHNHPRPQSYRALKTWVDVEAFRNPAFNWFTAAVAFMFLGFYPVFFNLEGWAAFYGYGTPNHETAPIDPQLPTNTPLKTFWLLTIMNGCSTFGRLFMSAFGDRTGPLNMHICAQIISALFVLFLWTFANSTSLAIVFCCLFGMTSGAVIGLPPASMANILRCTYPPSEHGNLAAVKLGQWTGMMYSVAAIPSLVGPVIAGYLISKFDTYITVQMWAGISLIISAACMITARWYLPCEDGETVKHKIAQWRAKTTAQRKNSVYADPGVTSETEVETDLSRAATRVPSQSVSCAVSDEKIATQSR